MGLSYGSYEEFLTAHFEYDWLPPASIGECRKALFSESLNLKQNDMLKPPQLRHAQELCHLLIDFIVLLKNETKAHSGGADPKNFNDNLGSLSDEDMLLAAQGMFHSISGQYTKEFENFLKIRRQNLLSRRVPLDSSELQKIHASASQRELHDFLSKINSEYENSKDENEDRHEFSRRERTITLEALGEPFTFLNDEQLDRLLKIPFELVLSSIAKNLPYRIKS